MLYEAILSKLPDNFENTYGASVQERPLSQSPGALHLKSKTCGSLILNVMFFLERRAETSMLVARK